MAYVEVPTRTTADANSAADINQLQDNITAVVDGSKAITITGYQSNGLITGGLRFNTTAKPPYVRAGVYDNNGYLAALTADTEWATTDILGDKAHRAHYWYYVMMKGDGSKAIQLACGGTAVKTYNILSITSTNELNFAGSAGGTQPVAGMVAVVEGVAESGEVGFYPIASVTGSPVTKITLSGTMTNQAGAAGTVKVYYRIETYHGAGTLTGITTAANTELYTPSPADAEYSVVDDNAGFDAAKNGYYSKFTGYTTYRILGCYYSDGSSNVTHVFSKEWKE